MEDLGEPGPSGAGEGRANSDPELAAGLDLQEVGASLGMLQMGWRWGFGDEPGCLSERFAKNGET